MSELSIKRAVRTREGKMGTGYDHFLVLSFLSQSKTRCKGTL